MTFHEPNNPYFVTMQKALRDAAVTIGTVVETLPGGNQQKVVLACWPNHHAKILFFDEPTRGIDIGANSEIYTLMRRLTERGYSNVIVSSELPEIAGMCDRVAVFWEGRIVRVLEGDDINPTGAMRHATAERQP